MSLIEKIRPFVADFLPLNRQLSPEYILDNGNWFHPEHICDGLLLQALNNAVAACCPRIARDLPKTRILMKDYLSKVQELLKEDDDTEG